MSLNSFAELIVETVRTPLALVDAHFVIKVANPAFCDSLQIGGSHVVGSSLFTVGNGHWNLPPLRAALEEVLKTGTQLLESEVQHPGSSGANNVFLITCRRIDKSAGRDPLLLVTFDDISERRKLADALAWHSAELKRSNLELEQFAYVSSHDLQEPLRKIRAYGDLLKTESREALSESSADYLDRMVNAAERMQTLINDLLAYSRVATKPPVPRVIDLNKIVSEVLGDLDVVITETRSTVTVGELRQIEADPLQMRQVFQNLIGNALKFRRLDEGATIQVTCSPTTTAAGSAQALAAETKYHFRVADNGIGFDAQYAETIFAPFQRLHSRKQYAGTGIGLAICRRIIERHGGTISARGCPDAGAMFEFTLPAEQPSHRKTS